MSKTIILQEMPYPQRRDEIIAFTSRHHYSKTCPAVYTRAFTAINQNNKICACIVTGPAPSPTVARAFCKNEEHTRHHAWEARRTAQGLTQIQLDDLISFACHRLRYHNYRWLHTLVERTEYQVIGDSLQSLVTCNGFSGISYARNNFEFLGYTKPRNGAVGFIINNHKFHVRQGSITLTTNNVLEFAKQRFPNITDHNIRAFKGKQRARWARVLTNDPLEYRAWLNQINYKPVPYSPTVQPRLLIEIFTTLISPNQNISTKENIYGFQFT